jgi:branched-chain amino acid aminotransferase
MHRYILYNDDVLEAEHSKIVSPGQVGLLNGWGVFSTLRVMRGVLFAWERHYSRMERDALLMRVPFPPDPDWLEERLLRLIDANHASDSTLRVAIVRNKGGLFDAPGIEREFDVVAFTKDLADWGSGVRLAVGPHGRHAGSRFAGAKILSWSMNLTWLEEARERGFDELVLLNERNEVSECTSANLFAVYGNRVSTPPLSSGCLPGVTRDILLAEIKAPGLTIEEKTLRLEDLESADEVFITSTTRDLLPVLEVEGLKIRHQGDATERLLASFREYQQDYVAAKTAASLA